MAILVDESGRIKKKMSRELMEALDILEKEKKYQQRYIAGGN